MTKSQIAALGTVVVCSLLVTACQVPGMSKSKPDVAPMEKASTMPTQSPTTEGSMINDQSSAKEVSTETTYQSPAGEESVGFTLTVNSEGMITNALAKVMAKAPASLVRQQSFAKDFPSVVVGKKLSELQPIDRVGGSSLTTGAFNKALSELKTQL